MKHWDEATKLLAIIGACILACAVGLVLFGSSGCDRFQPQPVPYSPPTPDVRPEPKPGPTPKPVHETTHTIFLISQEGCSPCMRLKKDFGTDGNPLIELITVQTGPCDLKIIDLREARQDREFRTTRSTPTLFVRTLKGKTVLKHVGYDGDAEALAKEIREAMGENQNDKTKVPASLPQPSAPKYEAWHAKHLKTCKDCASDDPDTAMCMEGFTHFVEMFGELRDNGWGVSERTGCYWLKAPVKAEGQLWIWPDGTDGWRKVGL